MPPQDSELLNRFKKNGNEHLLCTFCGRKKGQIRSLVAGPGVYICDECVAISVRVLNESLGPGWLEETQKTPRN